MHIQYERIGGFAGLKVNRSFDTKSLPPATAKDVHDLVQATGFFDLPGELVSPEHAADRFQYKITIADEDHDHTVQAGEAAIPDQLWPLLQILDSISRQKQFPSES